MSKLEGMIAQSEKIVFLGGAGISTESGIPDFRSASGIYSEKSHIPPEVILSHSFFLGETALFYDFYKNKMIYPGAQPNPAHKRLAKLEKRGKLLAVITQNIDGLHQKVGSRNVLELHGSVHRNHCMKCGRFYSVGYILDSTGIPTCRCGGTIKPDVVLYEEQLNQNVLEHSIIAIGSADMLIVGGTSLNVYPAASLVEYYNGDRLVLINNSPTSYDSKADLIVRENIGQVLGGASK